MSRIEVPGDIYTELVRWGRETQTEPLVDASADAAPGEKRPESPGLILMQGTNRRLAQSSSAQPHGSDRH